MGGIVSTAASVEDAEPVELYCVGGSMNALSVMLYLADKNVKHELKVTMPGTETRTPEYMAMFPAHQVPGLKDGDLCLAESTAILRYIANKHHFIEGLGAYPAATAQERARVDMLLDFRNTYLYPAWTKVCYPAFGYMPAPSDEDATAQQAALAEALGVFKALLGDGPLLGGTTPNIADYSVIYYFLSLPAVPGFAQPDWMPAYVEAFKAASTGVSNPDISGYFNTMVEKAASSASSSA